MTEVFDPKLLQDTIKNADDFIEVLDKCLSISAILYSYGGQPFLNEFPGRVETAIASLSK